MHAAVWFELTVAAADVAVLASLQLKGGQCCDVHRRRLISAKAILYRGEDWTHGHQ